MSRFAARILARRAVAPAPTIVRPAGCRIEDAAGLITDPATGKYPHRTGMRDEMERALKLACEVWGSDTPWSQIDELHYTKLLRLRLEQLLTKRPENIRAMLPADWGTGYANVWLGTSVEDQERADERIPELLKVPARVRFLSCEPLLGPVDLDDFLDSPYGCGGEGRNANCEECGTRNLDWVIVGGESGAGRRPMEMAWLEAIVADCDLAGVAVFVKQDGAFKSDQRGRIPDDLWVREFPKSNEAVESTSK